LDRENNFKKIMRYFMQFKPFEKGIEVNGQTAYAVVAAYNLIKTVPSQFLLKEGIGEPGPNGVVNIIPDTWYSQEAWLRAFEKIALSLGDVTLFKIGTKIPENAQFPPWVIDIESAIKSIDIAYHMNHRKNKIEMFDPETGEMMEGIGHYGFEKIENENKIVSVCKNPYPCDFDRGILTSMAKKFEPGAAIVHNDIKPCRKKGADKCTYTITW
jgi:hypothetical protein